MGLRKAVAHIRKFGHRVVPSGLNCRPEVMKGLCLFPRVHVRKFANVRICLGGVAALGEAELQEPPALQAHECHPDLARSRGAAGESACWFVLRMLN